VLRLNQWALTGKWTVAQHAGLVNEPGGRIAFRFHARDLNLVMGPASRGASVAFRVYLDGRPAGGAQGVDVEPDGGGIARDQRTYQLIRQEGSISDRLFEIEFLDAGVEAFAFTFG
jgi:Thioredoxin like C-terminal domain